ncbi:MAG: hypothetical protein AAFP20_24905 [Cyanobacteria bacterium J06614_10]
MENRPALPIFVSPCSQGYAHLHHAKKANEQEFWRGQKKLKFFGGEIWKSEERGRYLHSLLEKGALKRAKKLTKRRKS